MTNEYWNHIVVDCFGFTIERHTNMIQTGRTMQPSSDPRHTANLVEMEAKFWMMEGDHRRVSVALTAAAHSYFDDDIKQRLFDVNAKYAAKVA